MKIIIPGGSGQVGNIVARHLQAGGHSVTVLSRKPKPAPWRTLFWDGTTLGPWTEELEGADAVIHLSGRSVNCRYTRRNRKEILESRTLPTLLVGQAIQQAKVPPHVWMNASTSTIYRHSLDRDMDEASGVIGGDEADIPETWAFSVGIAKKWEAAFNLIPTPNTRKIALRTSMVMSPDAEGVFDVLLGLVRNGLGGRQGKGTQYVSWIHDQDYARAIEFLLRQDNIAGPVNMTSPNPLPNQEFMRDLRAAAGRNFGMPAAQWMLEIGAVFLQTETELILKSRRVVPGTLIESGFDFGCPFWEAASRNLFRRWKHLQEHQ